MRVLLTTDTIGGVWTYARELVAGAGEQVELVLAAIGPPPDRAQQAELRALPLAAFEHRNLALEWMDDPWRDVAAAGEWLVELRDRHGADIVHLNGFANAASPFGVPVVVVGHSCVLSWHEAVRRRPAGPEWERYRDEVARGLAHADVLVAPTAALLSELERLYAPACEGRVIPNGVDPAGLKPRDKRPYVLGVGRAWDDAKNLGALERVARELPWPVLVAGDGGSLGRVDPQALRTLYGHASVFAEPARYEPFGLAALEAGLSGCALVLGDIPTLREVWDGAALYVDPFDDEALAAALRELASDGRRREALAAAARRRALRYGRDELAAAYLDLYVGLAADTRVGAAA
jgi:glycosyltransferase involved in cell wall biosynthesis